jgi:hypothetical protein
MLATAVRMRLLDAPYGLKAGGQSVAIAPWLASVGVHAAGGLKGNDSLRLCFADRREIALYADGRFRLAMAGTAGVRFIRTDADAYAQFCGTSNAASTAPAPAAPTTPAATPDAPSAARTAPTPPPMQASHTGALTPTARCQHCSARNVIPSAVCIGCGDADWQAA